MDNDTIPIGFKMELAQNVEALTEFSKLPEEQKKTIIEKSREKHSKEAMKSYVTNGFH